MQGWTALASRGSPSSSGMGRPGGSLVQPAPQPRPVLKLSLLIAFMLCDNVDVMVQELPPLHQHSGVGGVRLPARPRHRKPRHLPRPRPVRLGGAGGVEAVCVARGQEADEGGEGSAPQRLLVVVTPASQTAVAVDGGDEAVQQGGRVGGQVVAATFPCEKINNLLGISNIYSGWCPLLSGRLGRLPADSSVGRAWQPAAAWTSPSRTEIKHLKQVFYYISFIS